MPKVDLPPAAKREQSYAAYLDLAFRRIQDVLESLADVEQGINEVTGSLEIDTGIPEVYNGFAGLNGTPESGACFVRCYPKGSSAPSNIVIEVYKNDFTAATIAKDIWWLSIGK